MEILDATNYGISQGLSAAENCDVEDSDRRDAGCECVDDAICEECLTSAAFDSEENARSYSPFEHFARDANESSDSEDIWEAYDVGVSEGIKRGVQERLKA